MSDSETVGKESLGNGSPEKFKLWGFEVTTQRVVTTLVLALVPTMWSTRNSNVDKNLAEIKESIVSQGKGIDGTMKERIDNVKESVKTRGESIEIQLKSLDSKVDSINANLEKRLKEVEDDVDGLGGRVSSLEGDMKQIKENVNNIKEGGNRREKKLDELQELLKDAKKK